MATDNPTKALEIQYSACVWLEGDVYVAAARPLDVLSAGKTREAARKNLHEAVLLFLEVAREQGTLEDILIEAGYEREGAAWAAPESLHP